MTPPAVPASVGRQWADDLPPHLAGQAALLRALVDAVDADPTWEALELSCSLAAGRGDELSDLDVGLWHADGDPPPGGEVDQLLRGLGAVVDVHEHRWDGMARWWVQYTDGVQLDLVVAAADSRGGRAPGAVLLLDRAGRFDAEFTPSVLRPGPDEPRSWSLDGWEALSNVVKYLHRGSFLEAAEQLHRARTAVFRVWAAGAGIDYPLFGLTSLLDAPADLPPGIGFTYPGLDHASIRAAAEVLAELLESAGRRTTPPVRTPLADHVRGRLTASSG